MKEIGIILFATFILTFIWKWRESKWIKNFQKILNRDIDFKKNRDKLHQLGFVYNGLLFAFLNYLMFDLTLRSGIMTLICGVMFWSMDILLNVFIKKPLLYTGKTAVLDKVGIIIRIVWLIALIAALFLLPGCSNPEQNSEQLEQTQLLFDNGSGIREIKSTEKLVLLYRLIANDEDYGAVLSNFKIVSQPIRGMFYVDKNNGDFYIFRTAMNNLQKYAGQTLIVMVTCQDEVGNVSNPSPQTFIVAKDGSGKHYLKKGHSVRKYKSWKDDQEKLIKLIELGYSERDIAVKLNRKLSDVYEKRRKLLGKKKGNTTLESLFNELDFLMIQQNEKKIVKTMLEAAKELGKMEELNKQIKAEIKERTKIAMERVAATIN